MKNKGETTVESARRIKSSKKLKENSRLNGRERKREREGASLVDKRGVNFPAKSERDEAP